jgi:hypothetical protein
MWPWIKILLLAFCVVATSAILVYFSIEGLADYEFEGLMLGKVSEELFFFGWRVRFIISLCICLIPIALLAILCRTSSVSLLKKQSYQVYCLFLYVVSWASNLYFNYEWVERYEQILRNPDGHLEEMLVVWERSSLNYFMYWIPILISLTIGGICCLWLLRSMWQSKRFSR